MRFKDLKIESMYKKYIKNEISYLFYLFSGFFIDRTYKVHADYFVGSALLASSERISFILALFAVFVTKPKIISRS